MYHGWADPLIPPAEQYQLLQRAVETAEGDSSRQASRGWQPAVAADAELCPVVHGARDVPLRSGGLAPNVFDCADAAPTLGRNRRCAGDDCGLHQVHRRYAARGSDDPAALPLPQGREIQGERQAPTLPANFICVIRRERLQPDAAPNTARERATPAAACSPALGLLRG